MCMQCAVNLYSKSINLLDIKNYFGYYSLHKITLKETIPMQKHTVLTSTIAASCPISTRRVDSNIIRAISFQIALFSIILFVTQEMFFAVVLLFDFIIRTLRFQKFSPFYIIANFILTGWGVAPKLCDESPKRFALYLGLSISGLLVILFALKLFTLATIILVILFICAILETALDFCIGCKIYYAIQVIKGMASARNIK